MLRMNTTKDKQKTMREDKRTETKSNKKQKMTTNKKKMMTKWNNKNKMRKKMMVKKMKTNKVWMRTWMGQISIWKREMLMMNDLSKIKKDKKKIHVIFI